MDTQSNRLEQLANLIENDQPELMATWRAQLRHMPSARRLDIPTLNDHIPDFLVELARELRNPRDPAIPSVALSGTPPAHGLQRLEDGFEIEEVVAEYNILRSCIHDLAVDKRLDLQGAPFHIMNRVLDAAIGSAVQTYATQQALKVRHRREEYLAFVAHDLRTPLNAIGLAARVLESQLAESTQRARPVQMLKTLTRNVQQLSALVDKILEENINLQTESGIHLQRRELDLWPLVEGLIHDLHPVAGTGSTLLTNQVPVDLVAYADASLLRRMFQNLIANAITYTPRGEITISARTLDGAGGVECIVADNGDGMSKQQLAKIFEKYESDPDHPGGHGLGLAIFKTFVDAHEGTISVTSVVGEGSTFSFVLPARSI